MRPPIRLAVLAAALCLPLLLAHASGGDASWRRLVDLTGSWRFQIGDRPLWSAPAFDDSDWDRVLVPSAWEDEGFPGYDGYAWYRRTFRLTSDVKGKYVFLHLGRVDDCDQVFINGHFVGATGVMPPEYRTGYHEFRVYRVPANVLRSGGENVIAVRVFDAEMGGGLIEGPLGLFEQLDHPPLAVDLAGAWRFRTGDDLRWRDPKTSEAGWRSIQVPATWEPQGAEEYDGYAWYRVRFNVPARYQQEELVLVLGQIDDLDEAYVNGARVGRTGDPGRRHINGDEWMRLRAYPLPEDVLHYGTSNVLAVRVYDGMIDGGIYRGPVGLMTREAFERWRGGGTLMDRLRDWLRDWE